MAQALLQEEPDARPTALDSLSHPWLKLDSATHAAAAPLGASIVQRLQRFHTYDKFKQARRSPCVVRCRAALLCSEMKHGP